MENSHHCYRVSLIHPKISNANFSFHLEGDVEKTRDDYTLIIKLENFDGTPLDFDKFATVIDREVGETECPCFFIRDHSMSKSSDTLFLDIRLVRSDAEFIGKCPLNLTDGVIDIPQPSNRHRSTIKVPLELNPPRGWTTGGDIIQLSCKGHDLTSKTLVTFANGRYGELRPFYNPVWRVWQLETPPHESGPCMVTVFDVSKFNEIVMASAMFDYIPKDGPNSTTYHPVPPNHHRLNITMEMDSGKTFLRKFLI